MRFTSVIPIAVAVTAVSAGDVFGNQDAGTGYGHSGKASSSSAPYAPKSSKAVPVPSASSAWGPYEGRETPSSSAHSLLHDPTWHSSSSRVASSAWGPYEGRETPSSSAHSLLHDPTWHSSSSRVASSYEKPSASPHLSSHSSWHQRGYGPSSSSSAAPFHPTSVVASPHLSEYVSKTAKSWAPSSSSWSPKHSAPASSSAKADGWVARPSSSPVDYETLDDAVDESLFSDDWTDREEAPRSSTTPEDRIFDRRAAGYDRPATSSSLVTSYTKSKAAVPSSWAAEYAAPSNKTHVAAVHASSSSTPIASTIPSPSVYSKPIADAPKAYGEKPSPTSKSYGYASSTAAVFVGGPFGHGAAHPTGSLRAYPTGGFSAPASLGGSEADASLRKTRRRAASNNSPWGKMFRN